MEHLTEKEKSDFAAGMRAAGSQAEMTYKIVAVLRSLHGDLPQGVSINGSDLIRLVNDLEARGIVIPGKPVGDAEVRSLRGKVAAEMPKISLRGIPYKVKTQGAVPSTYNSVDDLKLKGKIQEQMFEFLLMQEGDSREALQERMDEAIDPLMKVVRQRQGKR